MEEIEALLRRAKDRNAPDLLARAQQLARATAEQHRVIVSGVPATMDALRERDLRRPGYWAART